MQELGDVVAVDRVDYEPFTGESEYHGRKWNQIEICLSRTVELDTLVALLAGSGVPASSHLTYTSKMHMAGHTLEVP